MMDLAIDRADHIHARVGSAHSPQVADPRVGMGLKWTGLFERWWDRIIEARLKENKPFLTINPEFGTPRINRWIPTTSRSPISGMCACG